MRINQLLLSLTICLMPQIHLEAQFTPVAGWDNQLFPAYLIATASVKGDTPPPDNVLGDVDGQLGVRITATEDDQKVQVTVAGDEYFETSSWSGQLPSADETYTVYPKVRFRFEKLANCLQATPTTIVFRVKIGDQPTEETATTVTMRSINDCPFQVREGEDVINTAFTFAAYVNEQHPFVDKLLREALDIGIVDKFDGYQSGQPEDVMRQVYALWDLLVARDVRYSSITTTAASSQRIACQHVRMIEETANNSQANCVDGSVLLVSMLRKIGINAALVMQPGHCYVAFSTDRAGKEILGLETTLIGASVEEPDELLELLDDAIDEDSRGELSWPSFATALNVGEEELAENHQHEKDLDYAIINISQWRAIGVLPIPFSGREQFVAYDHSVESSEADEEE